MIHCARLRPTHDQKRQNGDTGISRDVRASVFHARTPPEGLFGRLLVVQKLVPSLVQEALATCMIGV
jgi:hypothetical protein